MNLWMNGKYINNTEAGISPFDHGYLYGLNFFEKFRTYKGQVVLFQEHYNRLISRLNQFHIKMTYSVKDILQVIDHLYQHDKEQDRIYLLNVSAGVYNNQLQFQSKYNNPKVIVYHTGLISRKRGEEKEGKWIQADDDYSPIENRFLGSLTVENLETVEGFFLSKKGIVTEGFSSTIFFVKDGVLYTPSLTSGITSSVIRQWVIHTAKQMGYRVVEDLFIKKDLEDAYECFVANSVEELVPISNIGNIRFLGKDGTLYQRLHNAYIEEILKTVQKGE